MAARGLAPDDAALGGIPPLVYVSITPFGQDGPKARWAAADLVLLAAGGPLFLTGDDDRPPVRLPVPQAWFHAAAEAAVGAMIAHHERQRSGRGQHVDVSAQQAVALATQSYILCAAVGAPQVRRMAGGIKHGKLKARFVYPARDGCVADHLPLRLRDRRLRTSHHGVRARRGLLRRGHARQGLDRTTVICCCAAPSRCRSSSA